MTQQRHFQLPDAQFQLTPVRTVGPRKHHLHLLQRTHARAHGVNLHPQRAALRGQGRQHQQAEDEKLADQEGSHVASIVGFKPWLGPLH